MSNRANTKQRRNWIKDFITNNAPTTVQHITDAALKANLKALSTDPTNGLGHGFLRQFAALFSDRRRIGYGRQEQLEIDT